MLAPRQITLIQDSFTTVSARPEAVAAQFYERLFVVSPGLRRLFTGDMAAQGHKLMAALTVAVRSLNDPQALTPVLQAMGRRHVGYGVKASDYAAVGEALISTLETGLGDGFTVELRDAWLDLYGFVAGTMIAAGYRQAA